MTGETKAGPRPSDLWPLWHFDIAADAEWGGDGSERLVGFYSSAAQAEAAILRLRDKPGFRSWPDGFRVFGDTLDEDSWVDGFATWDDPPAAADATSPSMAPAVTWQANTPHLAVNRAVNRAGVSPRPGMRLYRLIHWRGADIRDVIGIGVYSNPVLAEAAIARLRGQPGFRDWPDAFSILEYGLDEDAFLDGFADDDART